MAFAIQDLKNLFQVLSDNNYDWFPRTPDELLHLRKNPESQNALTAYFGLGMPGAKLRADLQAYGVPDVFIKPKTSEFAVSCNLSGQYILHSHWPAPTGEAARMYVHYGAETMQLMNYLQLNLKVNAPQNIADFGSSSGALAFYLSSTATASNVLALDICSQALDYGRLAAEAQNINNIRFQELDLTDLNGLKQLLAGEQLDLIVFNPPMVMPDLQAGGFPHRDGGEFGIELPLQFLQRAQESLRDQGRVYCLLTDPIIKGQSPLRDRFKKLKLQLIEEKLLNPHFNQNVLKERGYDKKGVERIELSVFVFQQKN